MCGDSKAAHASMHHACMFMKVGGAHVGSVALPACCSDQQLAITDRAPCIPVVGHNLVAANYSSWFEKELVAHTGFAKQSLPFFTCN